VGFWSSVARFASIRAERTTSAEDPRRLSGLVLPTAWIPRELRITNAQAENISVVYACIRAIAEALASSPWQVFEVEGRQRELVPDDPLAYLLNQRPNPDITAIAFKEVLIHWALSEGNGYAEIQRNRQGTPVYLWPLLSDSMRPVRDEDGPLQYEYTDLDGVRRRLDARDVYHLRGPVSVTALLGDSVVGKASRSAALMSAAQRFGLSYLANGAQPSGVLTYPGKLDPKSMERIRAQVAERQGGLKNAGKPLLLEGGMQFQATQSDPGKAMMHDTLTWSTEDLARYFGVPLVKLGVQAAAQGYGTNVSQLNLEWTRTGLRPWALRLEQEANEKLFPLRQRGRWRETTIDMEWLTRGDAKAQADADEVRIRSGVESVNEVRERLGRNTIGAEGDIRFIGTDLQPLTSTLIEIQEKAAEEPKPAPVPGLRAVPDVPEEPDEDDAEVSAHATALIGACLERYGSRVRARKRDLEKLHSPDQVEQLLAEERARLAPKVSAEVIAALRLSGKDTVPNGALTTACASVESGVEAEKAAAHFWGTT
jgi:HK97 family phage portal protein